MDHEVKIISKEYLAYNVIRLRLEKPEGYTYEPSQAIELGVKDAGLDGERSPFTFTNLDTEAHLELTIRIYLSHERITKALHESKGGDTLIITDPWDSFERKGPGVFIAGGTGVTPFIALLHHMESEGRLEENTLIFSNKTTKDAFLVEEFEKMLGDHFINVITGEEKAENYYGHIDKSLLKKHISNFDQPFYLCGPEGFSDAMSDLLKHVGVQDENIITSS